MELESRGSATVDKLSWTHCIKVIFSQMRMSGKIQKTGIKLGKRSGAEGSGVKILCALSKLKVGKELKA